MWILHATMTLLGARSRIMVQPILGSRGVPTAENWCPISHLTALVRRYGPWYSVDWWRSRYDRLSRVLAYQTGIRAKLESERAVGAWNSTTELLSGRDRPQSLCVLRLRGSKHKTQWTGVWCPPPPPPPTHQLPHCARW